MELREMNTKSRPRFVELVAVFLIVIGLYWLFAEIYSIARYGFYTTTMMIGIIVMLNFVGAYAIWNMKSWARAVASVALIINIGFMAIGLLGLVLGLAILGLVSIVYWIIPLLILGASWWSLNQLWFKLEAKAIFGMLNEYEKRQLQRICEECDAKDVTLHDFKGKLVCHDCWEKFMTRKAPPTPEQAEKESKEAARPKTIKGKISKTMYDTFPKLKRKKGKKGS